VQTLLLMRHAKSSWANPAQTDHERPLNDRGERSAPIMGEWLKSEGLTPDLIVCSDARRTRETADLVAPACGYQGEIVVSEALYLAKVKTWRKVLQSLPEQSRIVLCIGHNPGLEEVLSLATGQYLEMKTASIARLSLKLPNWAAWDETLPPQREEPTVTQVRDIARDVDLD
jgi:phosphohistidine phosphatase